MDTDSQRTTPRPPVLEYATPSPGPQSHPLTWLAIVLGIALLFAFGLAGVASDHVYIPLPKKIALTVASVAVTGLILKLTPSRASGCSLIAVLLFTMMVFVMWFWN